MPSRESWRMRTQRWLFNLIPAYRGTGGRVIYIADDFHEVHVRVALNWRTRNYVGTIFGGSMYGAIDPIYMMMLIRILGRDYTVWDKAATIRFRRPGRDSLYAKFVITPEDVAEIRAGVAERGKLDREFLVDLTSESGEVHASFTKLLNIRSREHRSGG